MNEYSEAAKQILPKLIQQGMITQEESNDIVEYIKYLEQQEKEKNEM